MAVASLSLVLFELVLTRLFAVILFASFAHLALGLALLGISAGALWVHLRPDAFPDDRVAERLAMGLFALGGSSLGAVALSLVLPVTVQSREAPRDYGERSTIAWDLLDPMWFFVLTLALLVPFTIGGAIFAAVFQRFREFIGPLYAADLAGGALACVAFLPLLAWLPAPDLVWVIVAATFATGSWVAVSGRDQAVGAAVAALGVVAALVASSMPEGILRVRYSAGYSEANVTWSVWTPLTRIAVHEDQRGTYLLLDNSSASEVVLTAAARDRKALEVNRGLVYELHEPPARVAILAASAGPEVAVAQRRGFLDIEAIDIAPQIGDIVADRFRASPVNPFRIGQTVRVLADGRAAVHRSAQPYDIIQMVHGNLHSAAGLLSNAWSSSLLETREAFVDYFDRLTPDGTLSFARGAKTSSIARSIAAALAERGVADPGPHVLYVTGPATVVLAKVRPWRADEVQRVRDVLARQPKQVLTFDPTRPDPRVAEELFVLPPLMTDDRPYMEGPAEVLAGLRRALSLRSGWLGGDVPPVTIVYHTLALQALLTALAGLGLVALGIRRWQPSQRGRGLLAPAAYAMGIGYGYLAIEVVLIHELVLFVGHPTYAVTAVVGAMLLGSGAGSLAVGSVSDAGVRRARNVALVLILLLGAAHAFGASALLESSLLRADLGPRIAGVVLAMLPLGFVMGMPWPLFVRSLPPQAGNLVPWAWALNGWMSVVASIATVIVSRVWGYDVATVVALCGYALAASAGLVMDADRNEVADSS